MTEISTRPFRHYECYSTDVSDFYLYIQNAERIFEVGDRVVWVGHNSEYIDMQVEDRQENTRWIKIDENMVFVCQS